MSHFFQAVAIAQAISILSFFFYGLACLCSDRMVLEFERFGLSGYRRIVGALEIVGALGLLAGCFFPPLVSISSGGLTLLMALGIGVRIRVGDSFGEMLPALLFLLLNGFILVHALRSAL